MLLCKEKIIQLPKPTKKKYHFLHIYEICFNFATKKTGTS